MMIVSRRWVCMLVAGLLLTTAAARADTIEVRIEGVKFVPNMIRAKLGDVIAFRHMPTHFVETVDGMWPEGAPRMLSAMGAAYEYRIEKEGLYVFKCPPHWGARMGGVVLVGPSPNVGATVERYLRVADAVKEAKPAKVLLYKFQEEVAAQR